MLKLNNLVVCLRLFVGLSQSYFSDKSISRPLISHVRQGIPFKCDAAELTRLLALGNYVSSLIWANVETSFSIFSICLPAIFQLTKRANQHGFSYLFMRKDLVYSRNRGGQGDLHHSSRGFISLQSKSHDYLMDSARAAYDASASLAAVRRSSPNEEWHEMN